MQPSAYQNLIQYATLASSITKDIASSRGVPFLGTTAMLSQAIFKSLETVKTGMADWMTMIEQIHGVLCAIINLYSTSETNGVLPPAILYDIAKFTETLQRIYTFLKSQQGIRKIKRIFKHMDNASRLAACKDELQHALEIFGVHIGTLVTTTISEMQKDAQQRHEELLDLLAVHPELTSSERSGSVTGTLLSLGNSTGSLPILPSPPQIFYGRDSELQDVVRILKHSTAHLAILGTGGMGKTSLAIAALHHPEVAEKYTHRYFVSCHSTVSCSDLARSIAEHIGCEKGPNMSKKIVNHFLLSPASLSVLDNFETPWEPITS
ncbi:hypothetical protein C8R44DRAFT_813427 [Mycena epipterygia]|nr:hypothetical protein C8R44DRAFT_813427 [Mycena epipterygia]